MFGLEISSVPVILPNLASQLDASISGIQWVMSAYTIGCVIILVISGILADQYGRKRVFCIAIGFFGLTSLACGLSSNLVLLVAARFLQGIAGGGMLTCLIAILNVQFVEKAARARAFSTWGVVFGAGLGFGPVVGTLLLETFSWRWVFLAHALLAIPTLVLVLLSVTESRRVDQRPLDVWGMITLAIAIFSITYLVQQLQTAELVSWHTIALAAITVTSVSAFFLIEKLATAPMMDFSIFRIRSFSGAICGAIGMNMSFWPFVIYYPLYLEIGLAYDPTKMSAILMACTVPTILAPPLGERMTAKFGAAVIIPVGLLIIGCGFFLLFLANMTSHPTWWMLLPGSLLAGAGTGLINTPVSNASTAAAKPEQAGMASGLDMSSRLITLAIVIAAMGCLLVEGIALSLGDANGHSLNAAKALAAGNLRQVKQLLPDANISNVHMAFVKGFSWIILFALISTLALSALSGFFFNTLRRGRA